MTSVLPQIEEWVARAREVAGVFTSFDRVRVNPDPVQVNFFQVYIDGDREKLVERHHEIAAETGTFLFRNLQDSALPGFATTEMHMFENAMNFDLAKLSPFLGRLLSV